MQRQDKPLAIFQMGRPPEDVRKIHGEQQDWVATALADDGRPLRIVRPFQDDLLPAPTDLVGAVLTGSWSMVTDREAWSERTLQWIREAMSTELPLLGICYGHQLMAHALGGTVNYHPKGREIGQQRIDLAPDARSDPLLAGLPAHFVANLTHEQSVLRPPPGAAVLGRSSHDPHQILRYGPHALSVQFHPEFSSELMMSCLLRGEDVFHAEGFDVQRMCAELGPTTQAQQILRRFAARLG